MKIAVVILNWNGKQLLEQFLPSVVQFSKEATVYIADNASTDDSVAFVKAHFPEVSIVVNPTNTGYALYDVKAVELAQKFKANFEKFEEFANEEILAGAPKA